MIEDHKQVGNLISVFQKYFLFGFAQVVLGRAPFFLNSQNVALIFLHRFPCSVEPMTFIFLFFQDSLPGISHYVYLTYSVVVLENTHLISQTSLFQSKVFDTIHIMIFLGTISNICGKVLRGLLKFATACIIFVFWGCFLQLFLFQSTTLISSLWDVGLAAQVKSSVTSLGCELLSCSNKNFPPRYAQFLI